MKILYILSGVLIAIVFVLWLGFQVKPAPFSSLSLEARLVETVLLPEGLPEPVERFYREIYGDTIPVIDSAVVSGRATLRIAGLPFPSRFRFTHITGQGYRHYIESCWFGIPLFKVNETFLDGKGHHENTDGRI